MPPTVISQMSPTIISPQGGNNSYTKMGLENSMSQQNNNSNGGVYSSPFHWYYLPMDHQTNDTNYLVS